MRKLYSLLLAVCFSLAANQIHSQTYCTSSFTNLTDDWISNVEFNTINNSSGSTSYTDFTNLSTSIKKGNTYTIDVDITTNGSWLQYVGVWIDWNQDGTFNTTDEEFQIGDNGSVNGTATVSGSITVPVTALTGPTTMRIVEFYFNVPGPCQTGTYGETEDYTVIVPGDSNDVAVVGLDTPSTFCAGTQNIAAVLENFGINQITSATVNWSVNGTLQTPVSFSGTLDTVGGTGAQTASVALGSLTFTNGNVETIRVWTTDPNNQTDPNTDNDTIEELKSPAMNGTYSIDPSGSGDFTTLDEAVSDLNSFGVCGPVTINMLTGVYNEQVSIAEVQGGSSTNTVVFQPDPTNTGAVQVEFSSSSSDNYVIELSGASYVTIDGIEIESLTSSTANTVRFSNGAHHNTLTNCTLTAPNGTSSSTDQSNIYAEGGDVSYNTISNNMVEGGSYNIYLSGSGQSCMDNEIIGNTFVDGYRYSVYLSNQNSYLFAENTIESPSSVYGFGYGFYSTNGHNDFEVIGNKIAWTGNGAAYFTQTNGTTSNQPLIANNWIHAGDGTDFVYGLYFTSGGFSRIIHNTIVVDASATGGYYGLFINGGANEIYNNIIHFPQGSSNYSGLSYSGSFSVSASNFNNVWHAGGSGPGFGRTNSVHATLAAWQSATGFDTSSSEVDPGYTNFDSLRTCNDSLNNTGMAIADVSKDIDGDDRDLVNPDMGADEWVGGAPGSFNAGEDAIVCVGKTITIGKAGTGGSYSWSTGDTTSTIDVTSEGTYIVSLTTDCGANHVDTVEVTDATPVANFTMARSFQTAIFTNNSINGDNYLWVFGDGDSSTVKDPVHVYNSNGPFTACLTVYNDCDTTESCQEMVFFVGIENAQLENGLEIYPNPANDVLNITIKDVNSDNLNISLNNTQGQAVLERQLVDFSGSSTETIDVSQLTKGLYFVKITSDTEVVTKRVVIQ